LDCAAVARTLQLEGFGHHEAIDRDVDDEACEAQGMMGGDRRDLEREVYLQFFKLGFCPKGVVQWFVPSRILTQLDYSM
jgi:hypothetical protein